MWGGGRGAIDGAEGKRERAGGEARRRLVMSSAAGARADILASRVVSWPGPGDPQPPPANPPTHHSNTPRTIPTPQPHTQSTTPAPPPNTNKPAPTRPPPHTHLAPDVVRHDARCGQDGAVSCGHGGGHDGYHGPGAQSLGRLRCRFDSRCHVKVPHHASKHTCALW